MATSAVQEVGFRPMVNTSIDNAGVVVEHSRVVDSLGRFHGLIRLVIENTSGAVDSDVWQQMLIAGAVIKGTLPDPVISARTVIFYKLEERQDQA